MRFQAASTSPSTPQTRWDVFERQFGSRARASDAAWARGLSPADRLAIVEDLFAAAWAAHQAAGDWDVIDRRAWQETLGERRRLVAAFQRLDEVQRGSTPLADAG